jgi:putative peptide zinc metalloprotease protein
MILDQQRKIFHESWYRLAESKITLRASVRVHRQVYRGVLWYVLYEPFTNQYYRLPQGAYEFISKLSSRKTVGEVWNDLLNSGMENVPSQGEVIEMLSQLYQSNMLLYEGVDDGMMLFDRNKKKVQKKVKATLLNIFFLKVPVFDPEFLLRRLKWLINILLSVPFALVWLAAIIVAAKYGIENFDTLKDQTHGFLSPSNIGWVYVCTVIVKLLHEFGHSAVVKKYGGEVHTVGIMFMLLAPLPYMDASASWSFRKKWHRVFVGAGGMLFEFFIAAVALILWANLGGGILKAIAYNVFIICSVSTVLFNINPLMRFDGYYILTDLLDMPNLQQRSVSHLKYLLERYVFRKYDAENVAESWNERFVYTFYGIASAIYRFFLFAGLVIAISEHYLILSFIMGTLLCLTMLVIPFGKFLKYIFAGPALAQVRGRAVFTTLFVLASLVGVLFYLPVPDTFTAPGVIEATRYENGIVGESGMVTDVKHISNDYLHVGDTLMVLKNPELDYKIEEKQGEISEANQMYYRALENAPENMLPIKIRLNVLNQGLNDLLERQKRLTLVAGMDGVLSAGDIENYVGKYIKKGDSVGLLLDTNSFDFVAVVSQEDVSRLFSGVTHKTSIRLNGDAFTELSTDSIQVIPTAQDKLPSNALGWHGGGDIETKTNGYSEQTAEPVYLVRTKLLDKDGRVLKMHGRSGKIRFDLGTKPLALQGIRKVRQALQKYYRL